MKYYKIDPDVYGYIWAWGESIDIPICNHEAKIACPLCGKLREPKGWIGPYDIKLNKKSTLGDFIYGVPFHVLCGENFLKKISKAGLKGISVESPVQLYFRKELLDVKYFIVGFEYSKKKIPFSKLQNEKRKIDKSLPKCSLCSKSGNGKMDNFNEIYFTGEREYDIFKTYERPGQLYCNERFLEFCRDNQITNIVEYCKEIKL